MKNLIHTLATKIKSSKKTIVSAESITAGRFAAMLTSVPGSSAYFHGWYTTYSNLAKQQMLWVSSDSLDIYGAVSEQVSREMALWAIQRSGCDISISFTGNAWPNPMEDKPVWLTYITIYIKQWQEYIYERYSYQSWFEWREEIIHDTMMFAVEKLLEVV